MRDFDGEGTTMSDIRDKAKKILDQVPNTGEVRSNRDRDLFKTLTGGVTQEDLMKNWKTGGIRTVCIDFVCWYGGQMGITGIGSYFDLKNSLSKIKKDYAWMPATEDARPQCGDILRHTAFHVDVALGFDGDVLLRAAGGQSSHPRPKADVSDEYDVVKRVRGLGPYDSQKLQGWLDIEKFFGACPGSLPQTTDAGKTGRLWLNGNGDVVHPDAPLGVGGPGFFRAAGPLSATAYDDFLPHPQSAVAGTLDPLRIQKRQEERTS
jgi:hypothetical protein